METSPLVSVGIPTYNRPIGLERTLNLILNQSYLNIEIIVSNNGSPNAEVEKVATKYVELDSRIKYYAQERNLGIDFNFKFVLEKASGAYFMWASDDDEWEPDFISKCLLSVGRSSSVMSSLHILYRESNRTLPFTLPELTEQNGKYQNAKRFLMNMAPSLFYGIHKRTSILHFLGDKVWDYYDCYFVLTQILEGGFVTIPDYLYVAGIDAKDYVPKPLNPKKGRLYQYRPFYFKSALKICGCREIRIIERISLLKILTSITISNFISSENTIRPRTTRLVQVVKKILGAKSSLQA